MLAADHHSAGRFFQERAALFGGRRTYRSEQRD
jgi:hypothetical protein